jgi:hypothetical protein
MAEREEAMKAWLCFLSVVVIAQGVLLGISRKQLDRLNRVLFTHRTREVIDVPEIRARKLTVRQVVLENTKGRPVGALAGGDEGGYGPMFSLTNHCTGKLSSNLQFQMMPESTEVLLQQQKHADGGEAPATCRLRLSMYHGRMGLQIEPAYHYYSREPPLSIGCGYARDIPGTIPYYFWGYSIPGLPRFRYPRELPVLRKELAALTPATDEAQQSEILHEIGIQHGLGKVLPEIARLSEAYPTAVDFPKRFIDRVLSAGGYEEELLASLTRRPTRTTVRLLGKTIEKGMDTVGETDLRELLAKLADDGDLPAAVRKCAQSQLESVRQHDRRVAERQKEEK